uniref:Uncharacterized protein n=1 Tax=Meloidogyne incognita TaxID=6306 RepID=A0A914KNP7_MELIC
MRYEGMEEPGDDRYDFWISLGSDELQHVGHWFLILGDELFFILHLGLGLILRGMFIVNVGSQGFGVVEEHSLCYQSYWKVLLKKDLSQCKKYFSFIF